MSQAVTSYDAKEPRRNRKCWVGINKLFTVSALDDRPRVGENVRRRWTYLDEEHADKDGDPVAHESEHVGDRCAEVLRADDSDGEVDRCCDDGEDSARELGETRNENLGRNTEGVDRRGTVRCESVSPDSAATNVHTDDPQSEDDEEEFAEIAKGLDESDSNQAASAVVRKGVRPARDLPRQRRTRERCSNDLDPSGREVQTGKGPCSDLDGGDVGAEVRVEVGTGRNVSMRDGLGSTNLQADQEREKPTMSAAKLRIVPAVAGVLTKAIADLSLVPDTPRRIMNARRTGNQANRSKTCITRYPATETASETSAMITMPTVVPMEPGEMATRVWEPKMASKTRNPIKLSKLSRAGRTTGQ